MKSHSSLQSLQKGQKVSKQWLLGFIESAAVFSIIIKKSKNTLGQQVVADFTIKLPGSEVGILEKIQQVLQAGNIYYRNKETKDEAMLKATKLEEVKKIINLFKPTDFLSETKRKKFELWSQCIHLIENKQHLTKEGILEIALLRDLLNRSKNQWNKKKYCHVRLEIDPCHVYQKEKKLPETCQLCFKGHLKEATQ
ncbi:MAG: LAGLIDADG family homing endonuclease [Candidatus Woesearchaeota archaeon]|nr:LAGLIDADG family homing endonuclease [Candidatus Woesearchaeota archaeon]